MTTVSSPVQIGAKTNANAIGKIVTTSSGTTAILDSIGRVYTLGNSSSGELGDGTLSSKSSPVLVSLGSFGTTASKLQSGFANFAAISNNNLYTWGNNSGYQIGNGSTLVQSSPAAISITKTTEYPWKSISPGFNHQAAIRSTDGALFIWGNNQQGQLGIGTTVYQSSPTQLGNKSWSVVSAALWYTAAIDTTGALYTWGLNTSYQLGDGTTINKSSPIQIGSSSWTSVSAGDSHCTAIDINGNLYSWGSNSSGQVGYITNLASYSTPTKIPSTGTVHAWKQLVANKDGTLTAGVTTTGALYVWGYNNVGQLGDGTKVSKSSPVLIGTSSWNAVAAGSSHLVAIDANGRLYAWGLNSSNQLGDGTTINKSSPVQIGSSSWTSVSAGGSHSTAIDINGNLYTWGNNTNGQIGSAAGLNQYNTPTQIPTSAPNPTWKQLVANSDGTLTAGITTTGALFTWGNNVSGQLGDGTTVNKSSPVLIGTSSWNAVSAGNSHIVAIDINGGLWAWGTNANSELGDGTTINKSSPVLIASGFSWTFVSAGGSHTTAIDTSGNLWSWGSNAVGQVGYPTNSLTYAVPIKIQTTPAVVYPTWKQLVNSPLLSSSSFGISTTGGLYAWGQNSGGQLGDGTTIDKNVATKIGSSSWTIVSAGFFATAAIDINGRLFTWGSNSTGILGDGTAVAKSSPIQIGTNSWKTVSAGNSFMVAIDATGALYTWGNNSNGQLGDGSTINKSSPVKIGSNSWTLISAGLISTIAVDITGTLWGWGGNSYGEIGNNALPVTKGGSIQTYLAKAASTTSWTAISLEGYISSGIDITGALYTWGDPALIGDNNFTSQVYSPRQLGTSSWSVVGNGYAVAAAIDINGRLFTWGPGYDLLGDGGPSRSSPVQIGTNSSWSKVSAGGSVAAAIDIQNIGYMWGSNTYGALAGGTTNQIGLNRINAYNPDAATYSSWTTVSAGASHTVGITTNGILWSWGNNAGGQVGYVTNLPSYSIPTQIATSSTVYSWKQLSANKDGTLTAGITTTGALYTWGNNATYGQLGAGTTISKSIPIKIGSSSWSTVSAGASHVAAIDINGNLYTWGFNSSSQLGDGTTINKSSPVKIGSNSWSVVSAGGSHTTAIDTLGNLYAWGSNATGQIGNYTNATTYSTPTQIQTSTTNYSWKKIATNGIETAEYTLAIRNDNTLWAWGQNGKGQLGDGTTVSKSSPIQIGTKSWTIISVGQSTTAAIDTTGALWMWGGNPNGNLGDGTTIDKSSPVQIGTSSWSFVSTGIGLQTDTAAIDINGRLFVWGAGSLGQIGDNTTTPKSSPVLIGTSSWSIVSVGGPSGSAAALAAIDIVGRLFTWGYNFNGQLGDGTTVNKSSPVQIGTSSWTFVNVGQSHMAAIDTTGRLFIWGRNTNGQLGDNTTVDKSSPVLIGISSWTTVSAGGSHTVAVDITGRLFTWGADNLGQLGDGTQTAKSSPIQIGTSLWTSISAGSVQTAALDINNNLYLWGRNDVGQLGDGTTVNKSSPVLLSLISSINYSSWTAISAGASHTAGVTTDGSLWSWGGNSSGQVGYITAATSYTVPKKIQSGNIVNQSSVWSKTAAGGGGGNFADAFGIRNDGTLWGWGSANGGQLGDNTTVNKSSPIQIGTSLWSQIGTGISFTAAVDSTGALYAWGFNNIYGSLGNSSLSTNFSSPVKIGASSWAVIGVGYNHTLAVDITGRLFTWGSNTNGQIGDGSGITAHKSSPVQIASGTSWSTNLAAVAGGNSHSAAIDSTGGLWTWGQNVSGGLGNGTTVTTSTPGKIGSSSWVRVSAGNNVCHAIDINGRLFGWGNSTASGMLGDGTTVGKSSPVQVLAGTSFSVCSTATSHAAAVDTLGRLYTWGNNSNGQLGQNDTVNRSSPCQVGTSSWSIVYAGQSQTSAVDINGNLYVWGQGTAGAIGDGTTVSKSSPVQVGSNSYIESLNIYGISWTAVSAGGSHTTAISTNKSLYTWGYNANGQLGNGTTVSQSLPASIDAGTTTIPINYSVLFSGTQYLTAPSTGINNGFINTGNFTIEGWFYPTNVTGTHSLFCLGTETTNRYVWQLVGTQVYSNIFGSGSVAYTSTVPINTWTHIAVVRTGSTVKLYINGVASATTDTQAGTIGTGVLKIGSDSGGTAQFVGNISNFRILNGSAIYTSNFTPSIKPLGIIPNTVLLTCDSPTIVDNGPIGISITNTGGATASNTTPFTTTISVGSWSAVSSGGLFTTAINTANTLYAWGDNTYGQLGDSTSVSKSSPVSIGTSSWSSISAGGSHTAAITTANTAYLWGFGTSGQLGDRTIVSKSSPVLVTAYNETTNVYGSWSAAAAGVTHTVAITSSKSLYAWGVNSTGQLGDGTTIDKLLPVATTASVPTAWKQISYNVSAAVAIDSTGSLWTWGNGFFGQIGDNTVNSKSAPVKIGSSSWSMVSAGFLTAFGITTAGALYGWGLNNAGQLGDGTTVTRSSPVQIGNKSWSIVSAGPSFTTAIDSTGALYTWGYNGFGSLGDNTTVNKSSPIQIGTSSWSKVMSGNNNAFAIDITGALWAWGFGNVGQLGDSTTSSKSSPVQIGTSSWTSIGAGAGITTTGTLYTWGGNSTGQLGDGTTTTRSSPVKIGSSSWTIVVTDYGSGGAAAIDITGALYTWGFNSSGQLGDGTTVNKSSPVKIGSNSWATIGAGGSNTGGISAGALFTWGQSVNGELGDGTTVNKSSPVFILVPTNSIVSWTSVSAGGSHTAGIDSTNTLYVWGGNAVGQLGDGTTINKSTIFRVGSISNPSILSWSSVSAGGTHTAAITTANTAYIWGLGTSGQLGDKTIISKSSPVLVSAYNPLTNIYNSWSIVSAGSSHTTGILTTGALYTWGGNSGGQIGDGTTVDKSMPTKIGSSSWKSVSAGYSHTTAIDITNSLYAWGYNSYGQLGDNTTTSKSSPVQVIANTVNYWKQIAEATQGNHTLAINNNGTLWAWGGNANGTLGDGTTVNKSSPVLISNSSWSLVSAGQLHSVAIDSTGALYTWGLNSDGRLGDGTTISKSSPVKIGTSSWAVVSAGNSHTVAIDINGALWTWGNNATYGQLGDGTTIAKSSPVKIGTSSWTKVSTGGLHNIAIDITGRLFLWGYGASGNMGNGQNGNLSSPTLLNINNYSFSVVSAGFNNSFAINTNGFLYGWGDNSGGQLGDGTTVSKSSPVNISSNSGSSFSAVSAGLVHTAAIDINGFLCTWGSYGNGALGDGSVNSRSNVARVSTSSWTIVSASGFSSTTTGMDINGNLYGWGLNNNGQLGDGTTVSKSSPVLILSLNTPIVSWTITSAGGSHTAGIDSTNTLYVWGGNSFGILGDNTSISRSTAIKLGPYNTPSKLSWTSVSAGNSLTAAITTNNNLYTWGGNAVGQLGDGTTTNKSSPVVINIYNEALNVYNYSWSIVSAGSSHTAGILITGALYTWGDNSIGQIGDTTLYTNKSSPVQIGSSSWSIVSAGYQHTAAIDINKNLYAWGRNLEGQIGDNQVGSAYNRSSPALIGNYFTYVKAGYYNTVAAKNQIGFIWGSNANYQTIVYPQYTPSIIPNSKTFTTWKSLLPGGCLVTSSSDNSIWNWGHNNYSQLGDGTTINKAYQQPLISDKSYTIVSRNGTNSVFAIDNTGALYAWGYNGQGQLGDGTTIDRYSPVKIGSKSWTFVGPATQSTTLAIDNTGALYGWGWNNNGQLGDGTTIDKSSPVKIGSSSWTKVASGYYCSAAIDINSKLYTWGSVGGSTTSAPTQVGNNSWTVISIPYDAIIAIDSTGTLYGWGYSGNGEAGWGSTGSSTSPIKLSAGSSFTAVASGYTFSLALDIAGRLYTWGYNASGQLGDNTTVNKSFPTQIYGYGSSYTSISAGGYNGYAIDFAGNLWGWGEASSNQIDSGLNNRSSPASISAIFTQMTSIKNAKTPGWKSFGLSAGNTVYGITLSDSLFAWGANTGTIYNNNAFGFNDYGTNRSTPDIVNIAVSNYNVVDVAMGNNTTIAITTDNQTNSYLYAWGNNAVGQYGDGTTVTRSSPVLVTQLATGYTANLFSGGAGSNFRR
jgi:alpha-tubulin suppressor-like RCC1 family protein